MGEQALGRFTPPWIQSAALLLIALALLFNGIKTFAGSAVHFSLPAFVARPLSRIVMSVSKMFRLGNAPPNLIALATGLMTVLLPCGHLYGFVLGAATTGSATYGAALMAAFWLGSTPALTFGIAGLNSLLKRPRAPRVAGVILVAAGIFSLVAFASRIPELKSHNEKNPAAYLRCE
jgi:sulfite exporter TauE/SafE